MDVRSCGGRDHQPRGTRAQADDLIRRNARSPERDEVFRTFFLTDDLHGWRFTTHREPTESLALNLTSGCATIRSES